MALYVMTEEEKPFLRVDKIKSGLPIIVRSARVLYASAKDRGARTGISGQRAHCFHSSLQTSTPCFYYSQQIPSLPP